MFEKEEVLSVLGSQAEMREEMFEENYGLAEEIVQDFCSATGYSYKEKDKGNQKLTFEIFSGAKSFEVPMDFRGPDAFKFAEELLCPECDECGGMCHSDEFSEEKAEFFLKSLVSLSLDHFGAIDAIGTTFGEDDDNDGSY